MYLFNMIFSPPTTYPNDFFIIKVQDFFFNKMNLVFKNSLKTKLLCFWKLYDLQWNFEVVYHFYYVLLWSTVLIPDFYF